jgi:hypothetical protein
VGHIRLGWLPKLRIWNEVVELLDRAPDDIPGIAAAVLDASAEELERSSTITAASRAFLVLLQLAHAAERGDIASEFRRQGVDVSAGTPVITALAELGDRLRETAPATDHYGDFASLALRRALLETVGAQGPSLFGSTVDELGEGFRRWTGGDQFGRLTRLFFGDFIARSLHAAVDRELSKHVGGELAFGDAGQSRAFSDALDRYARETAAIVQRFAVEWYAKHHWQRKESLGAWHARGFSAVALKKLRSDLVFARNGA